MAHGTRWAFPKPFRFFHSPTSNFVSRIINILHLELSGPIINLSLPKTIKRSPSFTDLSYYRRILVKFSMLIKNTWIPMWRRSNGTKKAYWLGKLYPVRIYVSTGNFCVEWHHVELRNFTTFHCAGWFMNTKKRNSKLTKTYSGPSTNCTQKISVYTPILSFWKGSLTD